MRLCGKGLHDLEEPGNLVLQGTLRTHRCRPCANEYQRAYKERLRREDGISPRAPKQVCKRGHALVDGNIDPERRCLTCRRMRHLVRAKERYWAHHDYYREKNRMRWRLKKGHGDDTSSAVSYAELVAGDPCSYCGKAGGEADHIIPIAFGGISVWENFTGACRSCNASKSDDSLLVYLLRRLDKEEEYDAEHVED